MEKQHRISKKTHQKTTTINKKRNQKNTYQKYKHACKKMENTCPTEYPEKEMEKTSWLRNAEFEGNAEQLK